MNNELFTKNVLGITITDESQEKVLEYCTTRLKKGSKKFAIYTPNPEMIVRARSDSSFMNVLNRAEIALPDGVGLLWASKLLGKPLHHRITGVDFMEELCKNCAKNAVTIGLLGGGMGIAEKVSECLRKKYPKLRVVYVSDEWDEAQMEDQRLTHEDFHIDILFVAFGFPKQEQWIDRNLDRIPVTAAMGVGGAFDYISGNVGRAPKFVRRIGFEWLWRLFRQPWRVKRQIKLIEFVWIVLKERFSVKK